MDFRIERRLVMLRKNVGFFISIICCLLFGFKIVYSQNTIIGTDVTPPPTGEWTNYTNPMYVYCIVKENNYLWWGASGGLVKWNLSDNTYRVYTKADGLASNEVRFIAIDKIGNKWIATYDNGVSKFDGTNWVTYNSTNSGLAGDYVHTIYIDTDTYVWFGTWGKGVSKFDGTTWTTYTKTNGLAGNCVSSIVPDLQGNKWFGTYAEDGVSKFNGSSWTNYNEYHSGLVDNSILSIAVDSDGSLWFGSDSCGVSKFDGINWSSYTTTNSGLSSNGVRSIVIDASGNKWFATYNGVCKFDGNNWVTYNTTNCGLASTWVYSIILDSNNQWFAGGTKEVSKYSNNSCTNYETVNASSFGKISRMVIDDANTKWFTTENGLTKFDGANWIIYNKDNSGLSTNSLGEIAIDNNNNKWISGGGVSKFDGINWTTYKPSNSGLINEWIKSIAVDKANNKWFTTEKGVCKFDDSVWTSYSQLPNSNIFDIAIDRNNNKWFSTYDGVIKFDDNNTTNYSIGYVRSIAVDKYNNKWFGISSRVYRYDGSNWTIYYTTNSGLLSNFVCSITIDQYNNKWIGTDKGLLVFDDKNWTVITSSNSGLSNSFVRDIIINKLNDKWIVTSDGWVSKFSGIISTGTYSSTPKLFVDYQYLNFGEVKQGENKTLQVTLNNDGAGTLSGTIIADQTWITIDQQNFTSNSQVLNIAVNTSVLNNGEYRGNVTINSNGGSATISVIATVKATSTSESWVKVWVRQLGTAKDDSGYEVAVDSSGNIYVTGYTEGDLEGNTNAGNKDIFLIKYDPKGVKLWTKQIGTSVDDISYGVATDNFSNVYITGSTKGGFDGNTNKGSEDIFLIKYDSNGNKIWTRQLGSGGSENCYSVATDNLGNIYMSGYTEGSLDGNSNIGGKDIILVKYDSAGNKLWTKQIGDSGNDISYGITTDRYGNIYLTGATYNNSLDYDIFITKYDSTGAMLWEKKILAFDDNEGYGIKTDGYGNVYVTGGTYGGFDGNTHAGGYGTDVIITKYNTSGTKLWTKQFGSQGEDWGHGITIDCYDNIYIAGYTDGNIDGNTRPHGNDMFIAKYDSAGNKTWVKQLGYGEEIAAGIASDYLGNVFITGWTYCSLENNTYSGGRDMFLIKYGIPNVPMINVNLTDLNFGDVAPNGNKTNSITISNVGVGTLSGTISTDQNWITASPQSFDINDSGVINITVNISGQQNGNYSGTITINSNGGDATVTISVKATCVLFFPNPYSLSKGNLLTFWGSGIEPRNTKIRIYTLGSDLVKTLTEDAGAETVTWDGKNDAGDRVVPGIYLYVSESPRERSVGRITVIK